VLSVIGKYPVLVVRRPPAFVQDLSSRKSSRIAGYRGELEGLMTSVSYAPTSRSCRASDVDFDDTMPSELESDVREQKVG
jgi:hypothetical protein